MPRKAKTKPIELIGPAAFYIGLVIALITAFIDPSKWLFVGLGVLGVIVGLLNITARETEPFLLASIAFIVAALGMQVLITTPAVGLTIPDWLTQLAANLATLVGAAAMVVALRAVYEAAKGR
ncbi:MAG: hypothetical protein U9M97_04520 [Candidatus Hadarchaeota archaeon]|nr:hypothetical protein [Candidatus Hadarchaeota archaeon]